MMEVELYRVGPRVYVPGHGEIRTPEEHPYGYSPYFLLGSEKSIKGASSAYSDRFKLWYSHEQISTARVNANLNSHGDYWWRTAGLSQLSHFLSELMEKDCKAVALAEGCNVSNGYPYWIVWWAEKSDG